MNRRSQAVGRIDLSRRLPCPVFLILSCAGADPAVVMLRHQQVPPCFFQAFLIADRAAQHTSQRMQTLAFQQHSFPTAHLARHAHQKSFPPGQRAKKVLLRNAPDVIRFLDGHFCNGRKILLPRSVYDMLRHNGFPYAGRTAQPGPGGPAKILKNHARRVRNPMFHTFEHKRFRSINGFRFPVFRQFFTGIARNYRDPAAIRAFPEADFRVAAIAVTAPCR